VAELRVPPPYLLAGHSLGGHIIRAFAAAHPGEVTGMVLVDARHERWRELLPDAFHARLRELSPYDTEQALQADEFVRGLPGPERVPVTVITHGRADWIPEEFGFGPRDRNRCEQAWQEMQRDLAAQFRVRSSVSPRTAAISSRPSSRTWSPGRSSRSPDGQPAADNTPARRPGPTWPCWRSGWR